jgi:hypothetical protein
MSRSDIDELLRQQLALVLNEGTEPVTADEVIAPGLCADRGTGGRSRGVSYRRSWRAIVTVAAVVALTAGLTVGLVVARRGAPPAKSASIAAPGSVLIGLRNGTLALLSPTTGAVERTVPLSPPSSLPLQQVAALSVTGNGRTVYVQRDEQRGSGEQSIIERVALSGGSPIFVADGSDPAVSPDGAELAYLPPVPINTWPRTVAVLDMRTGATRTWEMPYPPGTGPVRTPKGVNPAAELPEVSALSWAPDSVHLAVTVVASAFHYRIGIELVDTSRLPGSENPRLLAASPTGQGPLQWAYGMYRGNTGQLVVVATCARAVCGPGDTALLDVDPRTGHATKIGTLAGEPGANTVAFDRAGTALVYVAAIDTCPVCQGDQPDALYRWSAGSSKVLRRGIEPVNPAATAVAWVP